MSGETAKPFFQLGHYTPEVGQRPQHIERIDVVDDHNHFFVTAQHNIRSRVCPLQNSHTGHRKLRSLIRPHQSNHRLLFPVPPAGQGHPVSDKHKIFSRKSNYLLSGGYFSPLQPSLVPVAVLLSRRYPPVSDSWGKNNCLRFQKANSIVSNNFPIVLLLMIPFIHPEHIQKGEKEGADNEAGISG